LLFFVNILAVLVGVNYVLSMRTAIALRPRARTGSAALSPVRTWDRELAGASDLRPGERIVLRCRCGGLVECRGLDDGVWAYFCAACGIHGIGWA
jgi:hypothetical protein